MAERILGVQEEGRVQSRGDLEMPHGSLRARQPPAAGRGWGRILPGSSAGKHRLAGRHLAFSPFEPVLDFPPPEP